MNGDYHGSRLTEDHRRGAVWQALWRYVFRHRIAADFCVLDLGAGYGDFINSVTAQRRIAVDTWTGLADHVAPDVEALVTPVTDLAAITDDSVDFAFASNLFEHLPQDAFVVALREIARTLSPRGTLTILQPNYRYAFREYFDDYTHDLLAAHGWEVTEVRPRFLPLTVKSRLPVWPWLIAAYLTSPFKPMGKQMLIVARPR
jgi:SAM-dependent methyltransferase